MTLTKKQKKHALIILIGIIAIGIILFFSIKYSFSLVRYGGELQISNFDERTWTASETSHTSGRETDTEGKIQLTITHPSNYLERYGLLCSKINEVIGTGTCVGQGSSEPTSSFASRVSGLATQYLENSFIIFEGSYNDMQCISHSFKTYGLCNQFSCYIYDPAPNIAPSGGDCYIGELFPTSIKIYFKSGGYTEESGKLEFGLLPSGCYSHSDCPTEDLGLVCFEGNVTKKSSINLCVSGECSLNGYNYDLIETCENGCENAECKDKFNFIPILIIIGVIILLGGLTFVYYKFKSKNLSY